MRKYLIVGLGNIGAEYHRTRHNIGFDILDAFAEASNIFFAPGRYADVAQTSVKGRKLILIKPTTFMNLSGKAVRFWMESEKIPIENVLVVVDEIALPLGLLRFKPKGSDGGHNGLKDIQLKLNTPNYPRLRVGIGNDYPKGHQVQFVLGKWTDEEWDQLQPKIKKSLDGIKSFALQGLATTMNQFNG